jgi:phosphinothricin acetyltransferase
LNIREAEREDAGEIAEIYNHFILSSHATFETAPVESAEMARRVRETQADGYPFLVAEDAGSIAGYAYGHCFRAREAYRRSVETSIYIRPGCENRGIGRQLYARLISILKDAGFHVVIAGIALPNEASIRLHEDFGFTKVAHFREVGRKFGRWIDVGYWELLVEGDR